MADQHIIGTVSPAVASAERERRITVVGALIAMLLAAIDQASIAPAVTVIGADLGNTEFVSWVVSAYFVTATAVTTLYGKVADLKGRRFALFAAVATFVAGSLISASAPNLAVLIAGRAVQGLGGGGLLVLAQTIIGDVVPPAERGRYIAYISGAWAFASIAGPVMGGAIAEHVHWRAIFLINLPLAVIAIAICNGPLQRLAWTRREHKLDLIGAVLAVSATVTLMLTLTWSGPRNGWGSAQTFAMLALSALAFGMFVARLLKAAEPLIPLDVLHNRSVAWATLGAFFVMAAYTGLTVFIPIYLQMVQGLTTSSAGFALIPYMTGAVLGSLVVGRLKTSTTRLYRLSAVAGLAGAAVCLALLAIFSRRLSLPAVEVLILLIGFGLGSNFPVTTVAVQNAVDVRDLGAATGVLQFLRSLGSAIGIAGLGAAAASSGIVATIGSRLAAASPGAVGSTGASFTPVFLLTALGAIIGLTCLMLVEDRPLRGRT